MWSLSQAIVRQWKRREVSMDYRLAHYLEISSRIRSRKNFCEFLACGGSVWDKPNGSAWRNVTVDVMERERRTIEQLECVRSRLYPDMAAEEAPPVHTH